MRIYLDNCVIQDLKRQENIDFLNAVIEDKVFNVYCYSEAHLQDLMRDKSNHKFDDLKFMEKVVDENCWHYNKKILFDHIKPKDYYNPFPEYSDSLIDTNEYFSDDLILKSMESIFKNIPLDFKYFFQPELLPTDFPKELRKILEEPTNFYEFFCVFADLTNELSAKQKEFKKLISYLHNNNLTSSIFQQIGIEGYDGKEITDKDKFRESYTKYFLNNNKGKYRYDLFLEQYNGLEFFSFVKGKPRKQQMMNLINDGRHAFFGGFCDIVVSKDVDFIEKTKFIYDIHGIETLVYNINEFQEFLLKSKMEKELGLIDMIEDGSEINENNILKNENGIFAMKLSKTYFSYFNTAYHIENKNGSFKYYTRFLNNLSTGTLRNEFEIIVDSMIKTLGADVRGKAKFDSSEIDGENWVGRVWRIKDTIIELNLNGKLYLAFYPLEYLESTKTQQSVISNAG